MLKCYRKGKLYPKTACISFSNKQKKNAITKEHKMDFLFFFFFCYRNTKSLIFYFAFEFSPGNIFTLKLALDIAFINLVFVQAGHLFTKC